MRGPPLFAGSYLAVWALAGLALYALDRPHGPFAAGTVVIAAGVYEITPLKRHFRRRCRENIGSGLVRAVLPRVEYQADGDAGGAQRHEHHLDGRDHRRCRAQKLLPPKRPSTRITMLSIWIILAPASVPGLIPPM